MEGETLFEATSYYRPFPDPADVFLNRIDEHSEYLLPVGTLSLHHLSPDWSGDIHFIIPIEPVPGYGYACQMSTPWHNYLCRPNWLGYSLQNSKAELAGDFRLFHKAFYAENPPTDDNGQSELSELPRHYAAARQQFATAAAHFRDHGRLGSEDFPEPLVSELGGKSFDGNWSNMRDFPISRYPDQYEDCGKTHECDRVLPQTQDGRDFAYIGQVEMWNYIGDSNGVLILFYDPQEQIALSVIDWS